MIPAMIPGQWYRSKGIPMRYVETDTYEEWQFLSISDICAEEDHTLDGYGWLAVKVHEIIESQRSGSIAVVYRQWFAPDGEPISKPKLRITSLAGLIVSP